MVVTNGTLARCSCYLNLNDILSVFAYVLSTVPGDASRHYLTSTPKGWTEDASDFCAATASILDIANQTFNDAQAHPPHRKEHLLILSSPNGPSTPAVTVPLHARHQFYDSSFGTSDVSIYREKQRNL
jgi:hypothetical protein